MDPFSPITHNSDHFRTQSFATNNTTETNFSASVRIFPDMGSLVFSFTNVSCMLYMCALTVTYNYYSYRYLITL
jgi:hypothetical protein